MNTCRSRPSPLGDHTVLKCACAPCCRIVPRPLGLAPSRASSAMAPLLRAHGYDVFTPTLTGLRERVDLASPDVSLDTHIQGSVSLLLYEDLENVARCRRYDSPATGQNGRRLRPASVTIPKAARRSAAASNRTGESTGVGTMTIDTTALTRSAHTSTAKIRWPPCRGGATGMPGVPSLAMKFPFVSVPPVPSRTSSMLPGGTSGWRFGPASQIWMQVSPGLARCTPRPLTRVDPGKTVLSPGGSLAIPYRPATITAAARWSPPVPADRLRTSPHGRSARRRRAPRSLVPACTPARPHRRRARRRVLRCRRTT